MSISLMTAVWRLDLPSSDKMVLLALADAANDDGITWMALQSKEGVKLDLLKKTSLSRRAVQGALKRLCDAGYLSRIDRPGKGVIWTVKGCSTCAPTDERGAARAPGGAADAPKPLLNRQSKSISRAFPLSWQPNEEDLSYAASKGLTPKETERAREDFRGHFIANGKKTSTDWSLNWQRWCRVAADDKHRRSPSQAGKPIARGHRPQPASMVDIILGDRAAAANQPDVSNDGWLPTERDGVFIRGSDTEQPF